MTSAATSIYGELPEDWKLRRLSELIEEGCASLQTGPFGTMLHASSYRASGTPVVAVQHIGDNRLAHEGLPLVDEETAARLERYRLMGGDILFGRKGGVHRRAIVRPGEVGWLQGSDCIRLRLDGDSLDATFVSFVLGTASYRRFILQHAHGATMPSLNQSILGLVPLPIPPLSVQREIASVLGSFDDKIELNRQMNETLEAMARALFKSWFVDFDPVRAKAGGRQPWGMDAETVALFPSEFEESELGEIPKGWRVGRLSDIATAQRAALNPMEFPDEEFDHFSLPAFDDGRTPSREYGKAIKSNKLVVPSGSVLFSKLNPHIPRVWLTDTQRGHRSVASTEFVVLQCKSPFDRSYVYSLLAAPAFLAEAGSLVTGTTGSHQRIPPDSLLSLAVVLPDAGVSGRFGALAGPLLKCTVYNLRQSGTLAELRDTLLPKLLSGEVRVREAEPSVEAVG